MSEVEKLDYKKFETIVNNYKRYAKKEIDKNIEKLIYANIYNIIGWINYNLKRSLCIENECEQDEIELAEKEIIKSIKELRYNIRQMNTMIEILTR